MLKLKQTAIVIIKPDAPLAGSVEITANTIGDERKAEIEALTKSGTWSGYADALIVFKDSFPVAADGLSIYSTVKDVSKILGYTQTFYANFYSDYSTTSSVTVDGSLAPDLLQGDFSKALHLQRRQKSSPQDVKRHCRREKCKGYFGNFSRDC